ncbi:MAG TPA: DUF481 domain-containing protein [Candidatus Acidoferrales bacterium]|nr:DUF481 domain-containing protein [Candidatus Acidoferrales bacterium]
MMRKVCAALLVGLLGLAATAMGDGVTLKNGDRLTGKVTGADDKQLTLKTDYAGEVSVPWSNVEEVSTQKPVYVLTVKKQSVGGTISLEGTNLVVHTASQGAVTVPLADVSLLRPAEGQDEFEKMLHPGLAHDWKGAVNLGFAMARGNSNTTNLNLAGNADRKTLADEFVISESSVYTTSAATATGGAGGVTADAILGEVRYQRDITPRMFSSASGDFTHDALQDLVLRSIYTGGLGWHAIKNPETTLDVLSGLNYTRESYSNSIKVDRNLAAVTLSELLTKKVNKGTLLTQDFNFYPDLSNPGEYRFALDAAATTKINSWLGWQISISDRYVTNPPIPGTTSNEFILSTGVSLSFMH